MTTTQTVWLSHVLTADTPTYNNGVGLSVQRDKQMCCGDSCNTATISLPNHLGSHVDAPRHFVAEGLAVDHYDAASWVFNQPQLVEINIAAGELITIAHLEQAEINFTDADLLLFKTNFEAFRQQKCYWQCAPGFAAELADDLLKRFPSLTAIGMDTISLTSLAHREEGRRAHRAFLTAGLRIFEDLSFVLLPKQAVLQQVVALPLRYEQADGAPCTVIGFI